VGVLPVKAFAVPGIDAQFTVAMRDFSERHEVVPLAFIGIYTTKNSEAGDRIGNDRKVLTVGTDERDCFLNGRHPHIVENDVRAWVAKQRC